MKKRIAFTLLGVAIIVAVLVVVKVLQFRAMGEQARQAVPPPEVVTTAVAGLASWETALTAVGSLVAVQGVAVDAELAGKVVEIAFEPGAKVQKGDLLVRQDTSSEEAQLSGALAQEALARSVLARNVKLLSDRIISQADYDTAVANQEQAAAQVENIRTVIGKKTIRSPFSGRLGIRQVNLGQILGVGDPIVTLQSLDPIFVNFALPQQHLAQLQQGLPVRVTCDALPGATIVGRISATNPLVDANTRNIELQATIANPDEKLLPGMFVNVAVRLPVRGKVLVIPATAVLYAPYGDSVFIVSDTKAGGKVLRQQFVHLGDKRGDFVAVTEGLKAGETIVSTGVFKLRNGQAVMVDNSKALRFRTSPTPGNS